LKPRRLVLWRSLALALWIVSIVCLLKAVGDGVTAEEALYNPHLSDADRVAIGHLGKVADVWGWVGWGLQAAVAIVLAGGMKSERAVRRVFGSLGILIGADGVLLLLVVVLVPRL
jgi:hypothetical protein